MRPRPARTRATAAISHAGIYGDPLPPGSTPDLHIEELQARAQSLGYSVKPHAHPNMLQLFVALSGNCTASIDGVTHQLDAPCVVSIPGGIAHCFDFEPGAEGWVLTVMHERVIAAPLNRNDDNVTSLLRQPLVVPARPKSAALQTLASLMALLHREFHARHSGRQASLEYLLRLVLLQHWRQAGESTTTGAHADRDRRLFYDFRALVEQHYLEHWAMADYARALRCSQPRLNRICRQFSGGTANRIVLDRVCEEARRLLAFTTAPAAAIGTRLGFQEASYFTRFFKQRAGQTPGEFRAALSGQQSS